MNLKKCVSVVVLLIFGFTNSIAAFASRNNDGNIEMNTGFETEDINTATQERIFMNMDVQLLTSDIEEYMISCFDVNQNNGDIALCFEDSARKKIVIYDPNGDFQYGYSFMESGSIGVEWDENNIIIYSVRGDRAVWVDKAANMIDMKRIVINSQNNTFWHEHVFSSRKVIGNDTYVLKHSKLIKSDASGKETILFDRSAKKTFFNLGVISYVVIFFTVFIVWFIRYCIKAGLIRCSIPNRSLRQEGESE